MPQLPLDTSCQAEYEDGYILDETEANDATQYPHLIPKDADGNNLEGNNTFADILNKRPEAEHGRMVRFAVFYKNRRFEIDWTTLPDNARPIRFRDGQRTFNTATGEETFCWTGCRMGYQYNDESGRNIQEVRELR